MSISNSPPLGIFDQNLTNYDEGALYGTALCRQLRQRGFSGCLVIQSANDEIAAEREYLAAGADGCLGKVLRGGPREIIQRIAEVFAKSRRVRQPALPTCSHLTAERAPHERVSDGCND